MINACTSKISTYTSIQRDDGKKKDEPAFFVDYYAVSGRTTNFHLMVLSYLKLFYDVNIKNKENIEIHQNLYVLLKISELAQLLSISRQRVNTILESLEQKQYLSICRTRKKVYIYIIDPIEAPRILPKYIACNTGERLLPFYFDSTLTVNDLIVLDGIIRFVLYGTYPLIEGFTFISYKTLAERANCDYSTVKRSIRRLIEKGYIEKFIVTGKDRKRHAYFKVHIPEGSYRIVSRGHNRYIRGERMQRLCPSQMQRVRPINILYNIINTSYLLYHSFLNTSYLNKNYPESFDSENSPPIRVMITQHFGRYQLPFRGDRYQLLFRDLLEGGHLMKERMKQIQDKVKENHRKNTKTNITGLTALIKAIIPEAIPRGTLLPMEKNLVKEVNRICEKEGITFREYLEAFVKLKPKLENQNKFYRQILSESTVLALARPEIFDNVFNSIKKPKKPQVNTPSSPIGVIIPTRIFYDRDNVKLTLVYKKGKQKDVSLKEGLQWINKIHKAALSNWDVYHAFGDYLLAKDIELDRYETSMRLLKQADKQKLLHYAMNIIKKEVRNAASKPA